MENFSIYRGQARTGIGDGDGISLTGKGGEQYLEADEQLKNDHQLQKEIRVWLTLTPMPAHYQALGDTLESWSCFSTKNYFLVVRLVTAGMFDNRVAYFAHARAWEKDTNEASQQNVFELFDPGLYLGQAEAFDQPWRDKETTSKKLLPELNFGQQFKQLDKSVAENFLTALLYARENDLPLIISVPLAAFSSKSLLPIYIAFARAALPKHLKHTCAIRIYASDSRLFIEKANVLVISEDQASSSLSRFPNALLIDIQGQVKTRNKSIAEVYKNYAEIVMAHLSQISEAEEIVTELNAISEGFSDTLHNLKDLESRLKNLFQDIKLTKEWYRNKNEKNYSKFIQTYILNEHEEYENAIAVLKGFTEDFLSLIEKEVPNWYRNKNKLPRLLDLLEEKKIVSLSCVHRVITDTDINKIINTDKEVTLSDLNIEVPENGGLPNGDKFKFPKTEASIVFGNDAEIKLLAISIRSDLQSDKVFVNGEQEGSTGIYLIVQQGKDYKIKVQHADNSKYVEDTFEFTQDSTIIACLKDKNSIAQESYNDNVNCL